MRNITSGILISGYDHFVVVEVEIVKDQLQIVAFCIPCRNISSAHRSTCCGNRVIPDHAVCELDLPVNAAEPEESHITAVAIEQ